MGVKEEGWSVLIWFCFQTTWCIRTIKISASHSLIALWVSAAGPGPGFGFLAVLPTLWGQVIYFGPLPCLKKPCFSWVCVWSHGARSKVFKEQWGDPERDHFIHCRVRYTVLNDLNVFALYSLHYSSGYAFIIIHCKVQRVSHLDRYVCSVLSSFNYTCVLCSCSWNLCFHYVEISSSVSGTLCYISE